MRLERHRLGIRWHAMTSAATGTAAHPVARRSPRILMSGEVVAPREALSDPGKEADDLRARQLHARTRKTATDVYARPSVTSPSFKISFPVTTPTTSKVPSLKTAAPLSPPGTGMSNS
jgi:hypothetical protein